MSTFTRRHQRVKRFFPRRKKNHSNVHLEGKNKLNFIDLHVKLEGLGPGLVRFKVL